MLEDAMVEETGPSGSAMVRPQREQPPPQWCRDTPGGELVLWIPKHPELFKQGYSGSIEYVRAATPMEIDAAEAEPYITAEPHFVKAATLDAATETLMVPLPTKKATESMLEPLPTKKATGSQMATTRAFESPMELLPTEKAPESFTEPLPTKKANESLSQPLPTKKDLKRLPKLWLKPKMEPEAKKMPKGKRHIAVKTKFRKCNPPFFRQHTDQGRWCPQCESGNHWHSREESCESEQAE